MKRLSSFQASGRREEWMEMVHSGGKILIFFCFNCYV